MKQQMTLNEFYHVCDVLSHSSDQELCEIYWVIKENKWDDRLGAKPKNFDELPLMVEKWYQRFLNIKTKKYYLEPYRCGIQKLVGLDNLYDYYNLNIAKASAEQVEAIKKRRQEEREREKIVRQREEVVRDCLIGRFIK